MCVAFRCGRIPREVLVWDGVSVLRSVPAWTDGVVGVELGYVFCSARSC
jgi:hypothetical protein